MGNSNLGSSSRRRRLGLTMLSLGVAMIIVDATTVNVAVPSIARCDCRVDHAGPETHEGLTG